MQHLWFTVNHIHNIVHPTLAIQVTCTWRVGQACTEGIWDRKHAKIHTPVHELCLAALRSLPMYSGWGSHTRCTAM